MKVEKNEKKNTLAVSKVTNQKEKNWNETVGRKD